MTIDAGEDLGWVQKMLGHGSLQMIFTRYYSWVKRDTRNDGSAFLKRTYAPEFDSSNSLSPSQDFENNVINFTSNLHQAQKRGHAQNA